MTVCFLLKKRFYPIFKVHLKIECAIMEKIPISIKKNMSSFLGGDRVNSGNLVTSVGGTLPDCRWLWVSQDY